MLNRGGFGSAASSSPFGTSNNNTTGGLFGSSGTSNVLGGGASTTGFGGFGAAASNTTTTSPFGANTSANANTSASSTGFGGFGNTSATPTTSMNNNMAGSNSGGQGTGLVPYEAYSEKDSQKPQNQNVFVAINAMPQYINSSMSELRLQDYQQGRRYGNMTGNNMAGNTGLGVNRSSTSPFGAATSTSPFGQANNNNTATNGSPAGGLFGRPASTGGTSLFGGGTSSPAQASPSPFGQAASLTPTSPFGQPNTNTNMSPAFGSSPGNTLNNAAKPFGSAFGTSSTPTTPGFGSTGSAGGLFGGASNTNANNNATSGFGGFGQTNTAASTGTTSGFGFGATANKPATSLFGGATATPGSAGAPSATNSIMSPFGSAATTNAFGKPPATASTGFQFGSGTSSTTAAPTATGTATTGGLFGATTAAKPATTPAFGGFGSTTNSATSSPFGGLNSAGTTNTSSPFGSAGANAGATNGSTGGLFGSNNNTTSATTNATATTAPSGGLFGSTTGNTTSSIGTTFGGGFGSNTSAAKPSPFGSLNSTNNNTTNTTTSTSAPLFGATSTANSSPFGGGLGGGLGASSTGFSAMNQSQNSLINNNNNNSMYNNGFNSGYGTNSVMSNGDGNRSINNSIIVDKNGAFVGKIAQIDQSPYSNSPLFAAPVLTTVPGQLPPQPPAVPAVIPLSMSSPPPARVPESPSYIRRGTFYNPAPRLGDYDENVSHRRRYGDHDHVSIARRRSDGSNTPVKPVRSKYGFEQSLEQNPPEDVSRLLAKLRQVSDLPTPSPRSSGDTSLFVRPAAFEARTNIRRLIIEKTHADAEVSMLGGSQENVTPNKASPDSNGDAKQLPSTDDYDKSANGSPINNKKPLSLVDKEHAHTAASAATIAQKTDVETPPPEDVNNVNDAHSDNKTKASTDDGPSDKEILDANGYWMSPSNEKLKHMSLKELRQLKNFTVGRKGFGEILFLDPVDLTGYLDVGAELPGRDLLISGRQVAIYPDLSKKPAIGRGINVRAQLVLYNIWPRRKDTGEFIKDPDHPLVKKFTQHLKEKNHSEFVSYSADTGRLVTIIPPS